MLSVPQAAELCSVSRITLWKYAKSGEIKSSRTPGGHFRIEKEDLVSFMKERGISPVASYQPGNKKILIVDDDPKIRKLLHRILSGNGYEMDYASDGFEAGQKSIKFKPHLIILDLFMPKIDGFEACLRLKKDSDTANTKIIAISGHDTEENRQRILKYGADLFLPKPLDIENIKKEIEMVLG